jgi:glycosyltransferase involved in cell wall biosynthesis
MRLCIVGKYPPIQGGVSTRTYWTAHCLAARGHEIHVVTNAKEARPPFRMHMRPVDWQRCEARYSPGSVTVHWTEPADASQSYLPMASPFVSKLAGTAARVHSEHPFDVIFSFYLEPYGVAGHLAAQIVGVPHVVRMAGSDAGRLWHHPQFEALYDHVLCSAETVITAGAVAQRAIERGVDPARIEFGGGFAMPDELFAPNGSVLDYAAIRTEIEADSDLRHLLWGGFAGDRPYFGIYGKLGEHKGSFSLLAALRHLKLAGIDAGLVVLAHGQTEVQRRFRAQAAKLDVVDRILQIPFLPHWRIPEFLRGCLAVCCLEQDFPISIHTPIIACETLLSGTCLVVSTELLQKLPGCGRLPHGYGCVAVKDVNDVEALSEQLAAIVTDPGPVRAMGARGRTFALELQQQQPFAEKLERILSTAAERNQIGSIRTRPILRNQDQISDDVGFPLTRIALKAIEKIDRVPTTTRLPSEQEIDLECARDTLARIECAITTGRLELKRLVPAVQIEVTMAAAEEELSASQGQSFEPLFRLQIRRWAMADGDLAGLVPLPAPHLRLLEFAYDVADFRNARKIADLPEVPRPVRSYIAVFGSSHGQRRQPLLVDDLTAQIIKLSDGTKTVSEIIKELSNDFGSTELDQLNWMENLFVQGLLQLREVRTNSRDSKLYPSQISADS